MNDTKEKSAVGAATPATESRENSTTESIAENSGIIKIIPIENLKHHPDNPRKDIGDISELTESIRKNGIMQNLTVVPEDGELWVLIGNRRFEAAKAAGLAYLPCKIVEGLSQAEQVGIMLEENMQRNDLTIIEQAQGFQLMLDLGETVHSIAERTGFSETTVRHRIKINELDSEALAKASESFQLSLFNLTELEKIEDIEKRNSLLRGAYSSDNLRVSTGAALREQERKKGINRIIARLREMGFQDGGYKTNDYWSSKYEVVKRFACNTDPETIGDIENTGDMGYGEHYSEVYLMRKAKPEKEKKGLTAEEKKRREIAKNRKQVSAAINQMLSEFREFLKEKFRDTGILRHKDRMDERVVREAWEIMNGFGLITIYQSTLLDALLPKGYHASDQQEKDMAMHQLSRVPVAYQMAWAASNNSSSYDIMQFTGKYSRNSGKVYERLYNLLHLWGFRFAEDKEEEFEEILDGTSELYVREEKENV